MERSKFNRIKEVIKENKSTGVALAKWLAVSPGKVSLWVTNKQQPSIEQLYLIATYFNINAHDLLIPTKSIKKAV